MFRQFSERFKQVGAFLNFSKISFGPPFLTTWLLVVPPLHLTKILLYTHEFLSTVSHKYLLARLGLSTSNNSFASVISPGMSDSALNICAELSWEVM